MYDLITEIGRLDQHYGVWVIGHGLETFEMYYLLLRRQLKVVLAEVM